MMHPTIHLNGTGGATLLAEIEAAVQAVQDAHRALRLMTVHGRDYYPQGPEAFDRALAEHINRLFLIEQVEEQLFQMYQQLSEEVK